MLPYENYVALMRELDELVSAFQAHPDPHTRDAALALLNGLDLLHREGLQRLVSALRERDAGHALEEGVEEDRVIRAFLGLYDLADLDLPSTTSGSPDGAGPETPGGVDPEPPHGEGAATPGVPDQAHAPGSHDGPPAAGFVPLSHLRNRRKDAGGGSQADPPEGPGEGEPQGEGE